MRCVECEPVSLARFCECCGRDLALLDSRPEESHHVGAQIEETSQLSLPIAMTPAISIETPTISIETTPAISGEIETRSHDCEQIDAGDPFSARDDARPDPLSALETSWVRCDDPQIDDDIFQAFEQLGSIESVDVTPPANDEPTALVAVQPVEEIVAASTTPTEASETSSSFTPAAEVESPHVPEAATMPMSDVVAAGPATVEPEEEKPKENLPTRANADVISGEKPRRPAAAARDRYVPYVPPRQQRRTSPRVAAGVLVGALALGAYWLRVHETSQIARVNQPVQSAHQPVQSAPQGHGAPGASTENRPASASDRAAVTLPASQDRNSAPPKEQAAVTTTKTEAHDAATSKERPAAAPIAQDRKPPTTAAPKVSAPSQAKTVTPARPPRRAIAPAVVDKPVHQQDASREAPVPASASVMAAPVAEVAAAAPTPPPAAVPAPTAAGPFFETTDVNESPRIVTRTEPTLPSELRSRQINEVVIVRALVSQSGQPSRVTLLRRSKAGAQVDDVVLEAVNRWTFSPAKKKGASVSCWYNFAVHVGGAE